MRRQVCNRFAIMRRLVRNQFATDSQLIRNNSPNIPPYAAHMTRYAQLHTRAHKLLGSYYSYNQLYALLHAALKRAAALP